MKDKIIEFTLVLLIIITGLACNKCTQDKQREIDRLKKNEVQLTKKADVDTVNHITGVSLLTAKSESEAKTLLTEQEISAIKKLNINTKRLNEITTLTATTRIDTFVKIDTVTVNDTIIPSFHYTDKYCDFAGELENGQISFDMRLNDSISIIAHRVPKKLLWGLIKYGTKEIELEVVNTNPYSIVRSAKRVQIVK